jgi:hypothetical protein
LIPLQHPPFDTKPAQCWETRYVFATDEAPDHDHAIVGRLVNIESTVTVVFPPALIVP